MTKSIYQDSHYEVDVDEGQELVFGVILHYICEHWMKYPP